MRLVFAGMEIGAARKLFSGVLMRSAPFIAIRTDTAGIDEARANPHRHPAVWTFRQRIPGAVHICLARTLQAFLRH